MATPVQPLIPPADSAESILRAAPGIDDEGRAALFDAFHGAKSTQALTAALQPLAVPDQLKRELIQAKAVHENALKPPVGTAAEKGFNVLHRLADVDPSILATAEKYPKTVSALIAAATKDTEPPKTGGFDTQTASGATPTPKAGKETKIAPEPLPALPGGLPPTPSGHARVVSSDGGVHDIPVKNIDRAREIDPKLTILHLEQ